MRGFGWVSALLLASMVAQVAFADQLLLPQNDAGSGGDAGDDFESALAIAPGRYRGQLSPVLLDHYDVYAIDIGPGDTFNVEVFFESHASCAGLQVYTPKRELWSVGPCAHGTGWHALQSWVIAVVAPFPGAWFVRIGPSPSEEVPLRDYHLEVTVWDTHTKVHATRFTDEGWVATRVLPAAGNVSVQVHYLSPYQPYFQARRAFMLDGDEAYPFGSLPGEGIYGDGALLAVQAAGVGQTVRARPDVPAGAPGDWRLLQYWAPRTEPVHFIAYSTAAEDGWLTVAYDGEHDAAYAAGDDVLVKRRSDFPAAASARTQVAGATFDARLRAELPERFVGLFQIGGGPWSSPLNGVSEGGYTKPSGTTVELGTAEHPQRFEYLAFPEAGSWDFWFREDWGVRGDSSVLDGIAVPRFE